MQWLVRQKQQFYCQYFALQGSNKAIKTYKLYAEITQPTKEPGGSFWIICLSQQSTHHLKSKDKSYKRSLCFSNQFGSHSFIFLRLGTLYANMLIRQNKRRVNRVLSHTVPPKSLHWFNLLFVDPDSLEMPGHMLTLAGNHILALLVTTAYQTFKM